MYNAWHETYQPHGVEVLMLLGENSGGSPATASDAASYKSSNSLAAGIHVLSDPGWQKISNAVHHGFGELPLPYFIVFDGSMEILYIGGSEAEVINILTNNTGESPGGGCEGACGGQTAGACWCDDQCKQYGDCCPDVCEACGFC